MQVFVDTTRGSTFSIVLNPYDRVLDIKKQIENSLGIAVSTQELYYKGEALLIDDLDLKTCNIVNSSRLLLFLPDDNNYQVLPRTEQAPPPSYNVTNIEDSLGKNQGWPMMAMSNNPQMHYQTEHSQVPPLNTIEAFDNQGLPAMVRSNDDQMLHQTNQSLVPSNEAEAFFNQDWPPMAKSNDNQPDKSLLDSCSIEELLKLVPETPLTDQDMRKMQGVWPVSTAEGNINIQESSGRNDNNQDLLQRESSNTFGDFLFGEDHTFSMESFPNSQCYGPAGTTEEIIKKNQVFQTEQSTVPSNTFGDFSFCEDRRLSTEHFTNSQSYLPMSTTGDIFINKDQVFQTEHSTVRPNSFGDFSFGEYPLSTEGFTAKNYFPANTTRDIVNENQVLQTEQTPIPSKSAEQRINTQDLPVRVGSSNEVVQREKSPPIREVINIPDSPVKVSSFKQPPPKLRVMMLPYSRENKPVSKFPVNVNASENVEELRKELEKIQQRTQLNLPQEGYFFIHKQRVLDDDKSFDWNRVAHGDTIEIFPGYVTKDDDARTEKMYRTFGI